MLDVLDVKPLDVAAVARAAEETRHIVTVEDHLVTGGLGSAVAECVSALGLPCPVVRLGVPDVFSIIGPPAELYREHGYDATGIERAVRRVLTTNRSAL